MSPTKAVAHAIRFLALDAVEQAQSGHPGAPMGMADIAEVLWRDFLRHNPTHPQWSNRDRFVLSNGHGAMLLYSLLHLTGYNLSLQDLKQFRQLHAKTPGHPEYGITPGVETTTGPLGQGLANAVGMAIAEKVLAAHFNRPYYPLVDHYTYVFLGDGCLMEGISHEVCSLAGTLRLGKLIAFYDANRISIDGPIQGWFTDDTAARFAAYGWHVIDNINGHHRESIVTAITQAQQEKHRPSLLICETTIGYGSPTKGGSAACHGAPLGKQEVQHVREALEWPYAPFEIPQEIYQQWDAKVAGEAAEHIWKTLWKKYQHSYPELAQEFIRRVQGHLPATWSITLTQWIEQLQGKPATVATRKASQNVLEQVAPLLPELFGGSADLTPSNLTFWTGARPLNNQQKGGNYLHYGVREFGMSAIMNGIALHGGFIPYGGTFLVFNEYARNAVRMAALMKQRVIFIYTHDSIGLGEDGPTHQPVEQLAALRFTPNLSTWRPCDQVECAVAWRCAIERHDGPTALLLSRQSLMQQNRTTAQLEQIGYGGYILTESGTMPQLILIATGSEVALAVAAYHHLATEGYYVRVVSMPSTDRFEQQSEAYRHHVLPPTVTARLAIEASFSDYWYKYVGLTGYTIGLKTFGVSAPAEQLFARFGFTVENILHHARLLLTAVHTATDRC